MRRVTHLILLLFVLAAAATAQRRLEAADVLDLRIVRSVHPAPDGELIAFTRSTPRPISEGAGFARSHLFVVRADGTAPATELVGGKSSVRGVTFTPDGRTITFLRRGSDDPHTEVWSINPDGGEPSRVTETPHGVSSYRWRPDGKAVAYTVTDPPPQARAKARAAGFRPNVVDEDWDPISLWVWYAESGRSRRLTDGVAVYDFRWAPDGKSLVAAIAPRNLVDDSYMMKRLHHIDLDDDGVTPVVANPGKLGDFAIAPDSKRLAYISAADRRDPHAGMLYVVDLPSGKPRALSDGFRGMFHQVEWIDTGKLHCVISEGVRTSAVVVDVETGKRTVADDGAGLAFHHAERLGGGHELVCAASTATHPAEVFVLDGRKGEPRRLTDSNPALASFALGRQEVIRFAARDGLEIEGILIHPTGREAGTKRPLVIVAHGGPESHFSDGWLTSYSQWGQLLAARGYLVWYPNYRASTGYGVDFTKKDHGDPMGREFEDHLDAIAHFDGLGLIDTARVGIGGGSYGGYTAAWAATRHTDHFAAAVSFVPFVDIRTKWLTSDIPVEFYRVHYEEKWPHEQAAFLAERSPLTFAPNCRTPLLLLGGTADPRVHPSQPHMLYRAIKTATTTPVRYVQYPGEGHGNGRNVNRLDYALRTLRWFEHYLGGEKTSRTKTPPPFDVDYGL